MKTLTLMLALSCAWLPAQDRMTDTLRKGVLEEESQHNLAAAVRDYQAVVAQFDEGRKTAATALFRLAECYGQQGKKEQAQSAYQRLLREFPDQGKLAELSRKALGSTEKDAEKTEMAMQQEAARQREQARQRYRGLLLQEIELKNVDMGRMEKLIEAKVMPPDAMMTAREQKLKLERELAAFDMGYMPPDLDGRH